MSKIMKTFVWGLFLGFVLGVCITYLTMEVFTWMSK